MNIARRKLLAAIGGAAAAWPLAAVAQQPKVWRIGVLAAVPLTPAMLSAFRDGMSERGYVEGQNLSIDSSLAARNIRARSQSCGRAY